MKSINFIASIFLTAVLTLGMTADVFGQRQGNRPNQRPMWRAQGMMQNPGPGAGLLQLDLTDDQKEQMKSLMLETHQKIQPMRNQMREAMVHLQTLRTSQDTDMNAMNAQIDKIGDLRTQIMKTRTATHQEMRNLLTEEQRVKFDALRTRMGRGGKGGFGGRGINRGGFGPGAGQRGMMRGTPRGVCPWWN